MSTALSREQIAQLAYQVGFRGEDLALMVGIAYRESRGVPDARNSKDPTSQTGDFGLCQINGVNFSTVKAELGITDMHQLFDPLLNMRAAYILFKRSSNTFAPWKGSDQGFTTTGDPRYGVNLNEAKAAVDRANQQGLLGQDFDIGGYNSANGPGGTGGTVTTEVAPSQALGPLKLPSDAKIYADGQGMYALFEVGGAKIFYTIDRSSGAQIDNSQIQLITPDNWRVLGAHDAGKAEELRNLSFPTYKAWFDNITQGVMGANNPARNDPDVIGVLAEFAGRPDMTPQELQNRLQETAWFKAHTTAELAWNSLGGAEQEVRRQENSVKMSDTLFQFTGERVDPSDPRIQNYLETVSSGKMGYGAWTEQVVKPSAKLNAESPYSRETRAETEAQGQRGIDVENTAQRTKDLARHWGVQWSEDTYQDWARRIKSNTSSEADLLTELKAQASVLYPWKSKDVETSTAASPWIETYSRLMEKPGDLFDPKIQAALVAGTPLFEFEKQLKKSADWANTKNGRDSIITSMSEVSKMMGYQ